MKLRRLVLLFTMVLAVGMSGCSGTRDAYDSQRPILEVSHMTQSIGAAENQKDTFDVQKFSYTLSLENNDKEEVYVKEVHVLLPAEFEQRVTTKNYIINVDKVIEPNSYIEIENSHEFDAKGLTKEEIDKLNPRIASIKVVSEKTINLENRFK